MTVTGIRAGRAYVELSADVNKLDRALNRASAKLTDWAEKSKSSLQNAFSIAQPIAGAVSTFSDFDDAMRLTQAVSGATGEGFQKLTELAKTLGATTSWTAAQVANGMAGLGRAGFKTDEIEASIGSVMDLARSTGTEIDVATDIAGAALRSFSMPAEEMGRVCDVLTATANGSAQTLEDLGEAFKYVAPIAAQTGLTIEDTAKTIGALANFGVKGSQAGTVFKAIQVRMASDEEAKKRYAELGIDTTDAEGNLRKVNDVLLDVGNAIKNMPNAERLETIKTLFGQYGLTGVAITSTSFEELNSAIDNASGTAARTAQTMDKGLGGTIRITKSAIEGLALAFGESLTPFLSETATKLQALAGKLTTFSKEHSELITIVAKGATAFTLFNAGMFAVTKTANGVITVYKGISKAIDGVKTALSFVTKIFQSATASTATNTTATTTNTAATASNTTAVTASTTAKASAVATNAALLAGTLAITAALAAGVVALVNYADSADKYAESARKASQAAKDAADANANQRGLDVDLFAQLEELAKKQELTNTEFAKAQNIVTELKSRYGDLGIECDATSKKILGMAGAQERFNQAQRAQELRDIQNQIEANNEEQARIKTAQTRLNNNFVTGMVGGARQLLGGKSLAERNQEYLDRSNELRRTNAALQMRMNALNNLTQGEKRDISQNVQQSAQNAQNTNKGINSQQASTQALESALEALKAIARNTDKEEQQQTTAIPYASPNELDAQDIANISNNMANAVSRSLNNTNIQGLETLIKINATASANTNNQLSELSDQTDELRAISKALKTIVENNGIYV